MSDRRPEGAPEQRRRDERIQRQLDEALEDSFPASDPVSIVTSQDEEDWGEDAQDPGETKTPPAKAQDVPAPEDQLTKAPSAPKSSRPD